MFTPSLWIEWISSFSTVFLGIFVEAAAFLMIGSAASGLVEVFLRADDMSRLLPRNPIAAAGVGSLLGLVFPVCECGAVPLARRMVRKGLPMSAAVSFLLAAPVFNPIVIASTLAAFGPSPIFFGRIILSVVIAAATGAVFAANRNPAALLRVSEPMLMRGGPVYPSLLENESLAARLGRVFRVAVDEFFDMGRYLVLGAFLAALMQTLVPNSIVFAIGSGPVVSVLVLILLAVLLSVCSTVDAFIALSFAGSFTTGSLLAFLVFGPMVDIKSTLLYAGIFKRKVVAYIVVLPLLMTILAAVFINLNTTW